MWPPSRLTLLIVSLILLAVYLLVPLPSWHEGRAIFLRDHSVISIRRRLFGDNIDIGDSTTDFAVGVDLPAGLTAGEAIVSDGAVSIFETDDEARLRHHANADDPFVLRRIPMIPYDPDFPLDSTAETLMLKPKRDKDLGHSYHICTFTNVCAGPDGIRFRFQNHTAWEEMLGMADRCSDSTFNRKNDFCHCFHYAFKPQVLPYEFYTHIKKPLKKVRQEDAKRGDGKSSLNRRFPDPFAHVAASGHEHFWSIHKWVSHHHIAHWAQKLMIFQSIFQHHRMFSADLPPLTGMLFHDTSNTNPPLEDHLLNIFHLTAESALSHQHNKEWVHPRLWSGANSTEQMEKLLDPERGRLIWNEDITEGRYATSRPPGSCTKNEPCRVANPRFLTARSKLKESEVKHNADGSVEVLVPLLDLDGRELPSTIPDPSLQTCFARLSMSPAYGILSLDPSDADAFRATTAKHIDGPSPVPGDRSCPPRRAILLTRHDRRVLNSDLIAKWLKSAYKLDLEIHEISGKNSSAEQIALFHSSGLVLSSHSSQMINVIFSHQGQSLVEITPEFYNIDFAAYSHALGLNFNYALGGNIPTSSAEDPRQTPDYVYVKDQKVLDCVYGLNAACPMGDSWCVNRVSWKECHVTAWPNKQMNFYANLTAVQAAVQRSMSHLQDRCFGKW